jgi:hypothetical protein
METFLINSDLFFDANVSGLQTHLLRIYANKTPRILAGTKTHTGISTASVFDTLLTDLIEQFVSVSYGDPWFGQVFHLFLDMECDSKYRIIIWGELAHMLRTLTKSPLDKMERYLFPLETNSDMLHKYELALINEHVGPETNVLLFWVAIHHLSTWIFSNTTIGWDQQIVLERLIEYTTKVIVLPQLTALMTSTKEILEVPWQHCSRRL